MELKEKILEYFQNNPLKSHRAGEIAEALGISKDEASKIIKELKTEGKLEGRCAYKIAK